MRKLFVTLALFLTIITSAAQAQDQSTMPNPGPALILFYHDNCGICKDVLPFGEKYLSTETGKKFPLVIVYITGGSMPKWITNAFKNGNIKKETTFPTLIKWDGEKEIGRMTQFPKGVE